MKPSRAVYFGEAIPGAVSGLAPWGDYATWQRYNSNFDTPDKAFGEARRLIEEASRRRAKNLNISLSNLRVIPNEIANLHRLQLLNLSRTKIRDLRPIEQIAGLSTLILHRTAVTDLAPLVAASSLRHLFLGATEVSDLKPLAELSGLVSLILDNTNVVDLKPLVNCHNLAHLALDATEVADLNPLAKLISMTWLDLGGTPVSDIRPLANLVNLTKLILTDTNVSDLTPVAHLTSLIHGFDRAFGLSGLEFKNTSVAARHPFSRFELLLQPYKTVETINYVRRQQGLVPVYPENYEGQNDLQSDEADPQDQVELLVPQSSLEALINQTQTSSGAQFADDSEYLRIKPLGHLSDQDVAVESTSRQLQDSIKRKATAFSTSAQGLDNQIGWRGIGYTSRRFVELMGLRPEESASSIAELWALTVELGSFLEQDNRLRLERSESASPLAADVQRALADLVRNAAPWVRRFPTAKTLDDEAGAFLTRIDILVPSEELFRAAGQKQLLTEEDKNALMALVDAAKRGDLQGKKATSYAYGSARNLVIKSAAALSIFYLGAAQNNFAADSRLAKRAAQVMITAEGSILSLFETASPDIRLAMEMLIKKIKMDGELPENPPVQPIARLDSPPRRTRPDRPKE